MHLIRAVGNIANSTFTENISFAGGAIYSMFSEIDISKCQFLRNSSYGDGGAIYFMNAVRDWLTDSTFDGNSSSGFGSAAIYWQGMNLETHGRSESILFILESIFANNRIDYFTGSTILNMGGEIVLRGSTVTATATAKGCHKPADESLTKFTSMGGNVSSDKSCPE